jgi:hypothetical protein
MVVVVVHWHSNMGLFVMVDIVGWHSNMGLFVMVDIVSWHGNVGLFMMAIVLWVDGVANTLDDSVETGLVVGGVFNNSFGSVSLGQFVGSLDNISVTVFPLALVVSGVRVLDAILELVFGVGVIVDVVVGIVMLDNWSGVVNLVSGRIVVRSFVVGNYNTSLAMFMTITVMLQVVGRGGNSQTGQHRSYLEHFLCFLIHFTSTRMKN